MQGIVLQEASAAQDIAHIVVRDVGTAGFEAHLELDDDMDLAEFDTADLEEEGRKLEDSLADTAGFVVDILRRFRLSSSSPKSYSNLPG